MITAFIPPTIAQFKSQFPRDWPYGAGTDKVQDADIQNAINEGFGLFNPRIWNNTIPSFTATITGNTVMGSPTISALSSVAGLLPGQSIGGSGIPAATTILLVGASSIVISANATITASAVILTVGGVSGYTSSEATIAYNYLTAHLLVLSLQNSGGLGAPLSYQGEGSSGGGVVESKTVGSVSISYAIPDAVKNSPTMAQYMRTGYGQKYLEMFAPKLPGRRVVVVQGERTPDAFFSNIRAPMP